MKKIFIVFLLLTSVLQAQQSINGTWLLIKIEQNEKTEAPYLISKFKDNGKMLFGEDEIADWKLKKNLIVFKSKLSPNFSGTASILKINQKELIYQKDNAKFHYIRYNQKLIDELPEYKRLLGVWQMTGTQITILSFSQNHRFTELVQQSDASITTQGQWLYLPQNNSIVIQADAEVLRGKSKIIQINKDLLELKYKGINYTLDRKPYIEKPEEPLTFTYEEIENNEGDSHDFPWSEEALFGYLKNQKQIHYIRKIFNKDVHACLIDNIISKVKVDDDKQKIIFIDYLAKDEEEVKLNEQRKAFLENTYNRFFPQKDIAPFRIVNNFEKIHIEDKDYYCTAVEGFDGDTKIKYWMINDMPGTFAKIIIQNDDEQSYIKYELQNL